MSNREQYDTAIEKIPFELRSTYRNYLLGAVIAHITEEQFKQAIEIADYCYNKYEEEAKQGASNANCMDNKPERT